MLSAQNPMLSAKNPMLSANSDVGPPMLTDRYLQWAYIQFCSKFLIFPQVYLCYNECLVSLVFVWYLRNILTIKKQEHAPVSLLMTISVWR